MIYLYFIILFINSGKLNLIDERFNFVVQCKLKTNVQLHEGGKIHNSTDIKLQISLHLLKFFPGLCAEKDVNIKN